VKQSDDLASRLAERGYRLTPQRMMVMDAIMDSTHHISAEEIYAQVVKKYPHVNISTVYRTMELLKRLGLVMETDMGSGRLRYHPVHRGHHHHLVCQECGTIIDLDDSLLHPLQNTLAQQYDFEADLKHMAIFGRCRQCRRG